MEEEPESGVDGRIRFRPPPESAPPQPEVRPELPVKPNEVTTIAARAQDAPVESCKPQTVLFRQVRPSGIEEVSPKGEGDEGENLYAWE